MTVHASMRVEEGIPVLALSGMADERTLLRLGIGITALAEDVADLLVIEVHELVLADINAVRAFLAHLADTANMQKIAFACVRLSGRRLLRRFGGDDLGIYPSAGDAAGTTRAVAATS